MFIYDIIINAQNGIRKYTVSQPHAMSGLELFEICREQTDLGLACVKINNAILDGRLKLNSDHTIELILIDKYNIESTDVARHSCAHLLAHAVAQLYPKAMFGVGPATEHGFYYDILLPKNILTEIKLALKQQESILCSKVTTNNSKTIEDFLGKIEKQMHKIRQQNFNITRQEMSYDTAKNLWQNDNCKLAILENIPVNQVISVYQQDNFVDLCHGPHLLCLENIPIYFKLTKLTIHTWRPHNSQQQYEMCRIYGILFHTQEALEEHMVGINIGKHYDHRILGSQMNLFHFQSIATGSVFWHPKGWLLFRLIENYIRDKLVQYDYQEVNTPQLVNSDLWIQSGHWDKFQDNMFVIPDSNINEMQDKQTVWALKPMSCPCHIQIFNHTTRSYKELPIRMAEFGCCCRKEPSGGLIGLNRLRVFTQDDAHIFCEMFQIQSEIVALCKLIIETYEDLGIMDKVYIKLSDRPAKRLGSDQMWDLAEHMIEEAAKTIGYKIERNVGEGAFYGPKLEFVLRDSLGRYWQCGTVQLDFVLPERLGAEYVDKLGESKTPVMIHRAIVGSIERFIGMLLEHCNGWLPIWVTPIQIVIIPVSQEYLEYAEKLTLLLKQYKIRYILDDENSTVSYKIRCHILQRISLALIVGASEQTNEIVTIRDLQNGSQQTLTMEELTIYLPNLHNRKHGN